MDFEPDNFKHNAYYNKDAGRIEMYLVSKKKQTLQINEHSIFLEKDEQVHTENSYKYSPDEFISLSVKNGFEHVKYWTDDNSLFAVYLLMSK